jgi:hypothetical protein
MNNDIEISQSYESLPQAVEALCLKVFGAKPMYLCGMWGDTTTQNEEIRVQQRQIKALCEENQSLREDYESLRDLAKRMKEALESSLPSIPPCAVRAEIEKCIMIVSEDFLGENVPAMASADS